MTGAGGLGRCVLIDVAVAEVSLVEELPGTERISSSDLAGRPIPAGGPVDLVVIGSLVPSALSTVQRAHRLWPDASVAVLTGAPDAVRRQASFAPGVPLDLLVAGVDDDDLLSRLQELRSASIGRRRHNAVLAAVLLDASAADTASPSRITSVGALLEHAPLAVLVASGEGEVLGWNRRAERLFLLQPAMYGRPMDEVVPGALSMVTSAPPPPGHGGAPDVVRPPLQLRLADRVEVELSAVSSQTDLGRPVVLLLAVDVTEQRRAERERDRLAAQVDLLGRVAQSLLASLDAAESRSRLATILVPALADWVSIHLLDDHDHPSDVLVRHRAPALAAVVGDVERLESRGVVTEASRRAAGGEEVLLRELDADGLVAQVPDAALRSLVRQLGADSLIAVPIPGRNGVLGSLLVGRGTGRARFGESDLAVAVEIGRRAGMALDNARLYSGQRHLATELQQSLLTAPPVVAFADIAVRYVAAAQQAQVGGDWYDAFRQRSGDLVLVIGDVVGHDTRAAAAMGQVRGLLRGICFNSADVPSRLLSSVDEAIVGLELTTMATAVLAQLSPPTGRDRRNGVRMQWSNAGHPPPLLLDASGRARLLEPGNGKADLLLGVDSLARRSTEATTLPAASTLLFYTDGLVERRGQDLDQGLQRLLDVVERHADEDLEKLCDAVLGVMVPCAGEDDVAMVAVRPRSSEDDEVLGP